MEFDTIKTEVQVKEVMNSPVITVGKKTSIFDVARLMRDYRVGSVVVMGEEGEFLGIVTKTDIINRVIAEEKDPGVVKAEDIMSYPLITIDSEATVQDAAKIMRNKRISRLAVTHKGKLAGILSASDIIRVAPELMDIISEKARVKSGSTFRREESSIVGYCDSCGHWSDDLREVDGKFYCKECRVDVLGVD